VGEGGAGPNVFECYQANIGLLTPLIADALQDAGQAYGDEWVFAAIREAVASNVRSWKYCQAILQRWERDGFQSPRPGSLPGIGQAHEGRQSAVMRSIDKGVERAFGGEDGQP
jgi:DnaD/phage-associated family protein